MRNATTKFLALTAVGLFVLFSANVCFAQGDNLFQYACAGDDPSLFFPHPSPAMIKIYQDGRTIYRNGNKFYEATIKPQLLDELTHKLRTESFLNKSRYLETEKNAASDRGLCFMRYLDAKQEVIVATEGRPKSGEWRRVVGVVEEYLPGNAELFYPEKIDLSYSLMTSFGDVCGATAANRPKDWPFSHKFSLGADHPTFVGIADKEVIHYLFQDMYDDKLDWWWSFCENGGYYRLDLHQVPGWRLDKVNLRVASAAQELKKQNE